MNTNLPIGYFRFHGNKFINYQLNRWYSLGFARKEDLETVAKKIRTFKDYVREFNKAGDKALAENRLKNAATYYRAAEFLIEPKSPEKEVAYEKYIRLFDHAFADENYRRYQVPFRNSFLSVLKFHAKGLKKGTVLALGGFDSFIEDFVCFWDFLAENGYEVLAFEGPGQGMTLHRHKLVFDHDYEKPVAAVLDYFKVQEAAILGVSMGGYWVMRAAAFEKRITKVIAMPPVYDWLELTNKFNKKLVVWLLQFPRLMNALVRIKMSVPVLKHSVTHTLFITQKTEPIDAVRWMLGMNKEHLHSEKITQDVMLMGGENDAFQPPKLIHKQKAALANARTVSTRIFIKAENAEQHCQIGNFGLAMETALGWLDEKSSGFKEN